MRLLYYFSLSIHRRMDASHNIVSHTTDDMIFQWDPSVPLVVDDNIELPQLALVKNHTADCKL